MILKARHRTVIFPRRTLVMGIVNLNDDSFCGDGTLDPDTAMEQAVRMAGEGAEVIDIGAESARTNRPAIGPSEEIARLEPFVAAWRKWVDSRPPAPSGPDDSDAVWPPLLSLNTWRPEVAAAILPVAGDILNDLGGLPDDRNARLCAAHGAALVLMHTRGQPKEKHTGETYPDIRGELRDWFGAKLQVCADAGLEPERTILDPGLGFAKQRDDNLAILRHLEDLQAWKRPVLVPVSRKSVIGQVLGLPDPRDRDAGTMACVVRSVRAGAQMVRVHHVAAAVGAIRVLDAVAAARVG